MATELEHGTTALKQWSATHYLMQQNGDADMGIQTYTYAGKLKFTFHREAMERELRQSTVDLLDIEWCRFERLTAMGCN